MIPSISPMLLAMPLVLNLIILIPVLGMLLRSAHADAVFGADTPARKILISIYAAIALASAAGLTALVLGSPHAALPIITLMCLQIVYKALTLPLLGLRHPVAATNAGVIAAHSGVLAAAWLF